MSELQNLVQLLASSGQPPVSFEQLIRFVAFASRLRNEVLLVQPAAFNLVGYTRPVLPPTIQEFLSEACLITLPSINIIWKFLAHTAWNINLNISPASNLNLPSIYAQSGHRRGI
ncbi:hypothetical protein BDZ97DRAFT_1744898, partial [Flammula alnicola]